MQQQQQKKRKTSEINHSAAQNPIKLPPQLAALIKKAEEEGQTHLPHLVPSSLHTTAASSAPAAVKHVEEEAENAILNPLSCLPGQGSGLDEGLAEDEIKAEPTTTTNPKSSASIVAAAQNRFHKELCSYTRVICMRLGYA